MKTKIIFSALLWSVMAMFNVACAQNFAVDNIFYKIISKDKKTCEVIQDNNKENSYSGNVIVPSTVNYDGEEYSVTRIGPSAFKGCVKLKSISLPQTIDSIGYSAFKNCILLSSFTVPEKVKYLEYCFNGCISLESINLNRVRRIYMGFYNCSSLEEIRIPSSVVEIDGYDSFCGCTSLRNIIFEDGDKPLKFGSRSSDDTHHCGMFGECPLDSVHLGRDLYYYSADNYSDGTSDLSPFDAGNNKNNDALRSVYISGNVKRLGKYLFYKCTNLKHIYGMKNVASIDDRAFAGTAIKDIVLGNSVTQIGQYIFSNCKSLENVIIGDGVYKFDGNHLFVGCTNIKNVYLGKNITSFDRNAFCSVYGGTSGKSSELSSANVYLFSDNVTSNDFYDYGGYYFGSGLPRDIKTLYVINPDRYQTLFGSYYNMKPMLTFNESTLEYTGKTPELSYKNYIEGCEVSLDKETTPFEAGTYTANIGVNFSFHGWNEQVEIPCSYTITKAPLKVVANNVQRVYGEDNPELTCSYIGFKNGETEDNLSRKATISTQATKESNVGTYQIYCSGIESRNYSPEYETGILTINKAPQQINWNQDFSNVEIGSEIELTATSSSGLPVKYESSDKSKILIASKGGKQYAYILNEGTVVLTATQKGNTNYEEADEINKIVIAVPSSISCITDDESRNNQYFKVSGEKANSNDKGIVIVKGKGKAKAILK